MKQYIIILLLKLLLHQSGIAQPIVVDSTAYSKKFLIGFGVFSGPHYLLGQPETSEFNIGSNIGLCTKVGYMIGKHTRLSMDIRYMQTSNVINFKNQVDPDLFVLNTSTIQLPIYLTYSLQNSRKEHILGFSLGVAYQWNYNKTVYEELVSVSPSTVPFRQVTAFSKDADISIICGIYKYFNLSKKQTKHFTLFNEYQMNIGSSRFRDRIKNPAYLLVTNQDQFVPIYIRLGFYFNFSL